MKPEKFNLSKFIYEDTEFNFYPNSIAVSNVKDFIKKLQEIGLKKTLYPKYLMITYDDLKKLAGDDLI